MKNSKIENKFEQFLSCLAEEGRSLAFAISTSCINPAAAAAAVTTTTKTTKDLFTSLLPLSTDKLADF